MKNFHNYSLLVLVIMVLTNSIIHDTLEISKPQFPINSMNKISSQNIINHFKSLKSVKNRLNSMNDYKEKQENKNKDSDTNLSKVRFYKIIKYKYFYYQ